MMADRIAMKKGKGGMRYLELRRNGAMAHLYLHGAHVLHYQPAGQEPVLWHSKESWFEPGKPIRGGIPVCWPWFGAHPQDPERPPHGIARLTEWDPVSSFATPSVTAATLRFPASGFPDASLQLTVELGDRLSVRLTTTNTSDSDLRFTEALHSYFSIRDIRTVTIDGLDGQHYIDQLVPTGALHRQAGPISFSGETDRIYTNTPHGCTVMDAAQKRRIEIHKENSRSTVVWNPWKDKAARMPDFGNDEFTGMVCVETANCGPDSVTLPPGQAHTLCLQIRAHEQSNPK